MEALTSAVDLLRDEPSIAGLSRTALAFAALMVAYRVSRSLALTHAHAPAIKAQALQLLSAGTTTGRAVRMQAAFYVSYTAARRALEARASDRRRKLQHAEEALQGVADASATRGEVPFDRVSTVYKHVMEYCTAACAADAALSGSKPPRGMDVLQYVGGVQRESAVALESVLPRAGLQGFVRMPKADRDAQLDELSHIVVGIRLFNWEGGSGGVGLESTPTLAAEEAGGLVSEVRTALGDTLALCGQYVDVLSAVQAGRLPASGDQISAWCEELVNRRAACVLLSALHEDGWAVHDRAAEGALAGYNAAMGDLRRAVGGGGGAISKEVVYPLFSRMAQCWLAAAGTRAEVAELRGVLTAIASHVPGSSVSTLPFNTVVEVQRMGKPRAPFAPAVPPVCEGEGAQRVDPRAASSLGLALELEGTCPVSLCTPVTGAAAGCTIGVSLPGAPEHGLYRYQDKLFAVSSHEAGVAFAAAPGRYLAALAHVAATGHPALVHALGLTGEGGPLGAHHASFPLASFPVLASFDGDVVAAAAAVAERAGEAAAAAHLDATSRTTTTQGGGGSKGLSSTTTRLGSTGRTSAKTGAALVDVGVETPTHFVERHIDPAYHFSEWALRRAAIRIANIRQCATHGAQTDASNFRRENDTQVYLPRESGTQTGISVGSNTDRVVRYVGGLRGYAEPFVDAAAANVAAGRPALGATGSATPLVPGPAKAMRIIQATIEV